MITVKQLAKELNTSIATIYRMVQANQIPYLKIGYHHKTIRFDEQDIKNWIEQQKTNQDNG